MPKNKIKSKSATDKFYTKKAVSRQCIDFFMSFGTEDVVFIEPSAGAGSFSSQLTPCFAIDLVPEADGIIQADYLETTEWSFDQPFCVIGNPPFGSRNRMTNKFIRHSINEVRAKYIAFILPASYRKFTMQKVFPNNWSLIGSFDLPENSFELNLTEYHVPCVFQVWERDSIRQNLREKEPSLTCSDFSFSNKNDSDWFVFGAAPTKIILPCDVKSTNRGYFLKSTIDPQELRDKILKVDWKSAASSSVNGGAAWFPKGEFVKHYTLKHGA